MLIAIPKHKLNFYLEMDTAFSQLALQQVKYCMTVYRRAPGPYNYQDFTLPAHVKGRFHLWAPGDVFKTNHNPATRHEPRVHGDRYWPLIALCSMHTAISQSTP